jgi:hypothetical protein
MIPFLLRNIAQIWSIVVFNFLANANQKKYITFFVLKIELNPCLVPLVLMSPSALSRLRVAYQTGCGDANYYGAVFGH